MQLTFKTISSPDPTDSEIHDFIAANDNDFYPPIAARKNLWEFVQTVYDHKGKFVVCYHENKLVGLTSVFLDHPSFITYYHYVAIDEAYRHKGIATRLYNFVHEICKDHGVQRAIVKTWSTNEVSQAMFKKHGFFHLDTLEDDRSKGIHTYFFAKSFSDEVFERPVKRLGIVADKDNFALGNFTKTISAIPKTRTENQPPLAFTAISNFYSSQEIGGHEQVNGHAIVSSINELNALISENEVSHLLFLDVGKNPYTSHPDADIQIEVLDQARIIKKLVTARRKRCLLIAEDMQAARDFFGINELITPSSETATRVSEIVNEIKCGKVSPSYHKEEIASIAALNSCDLILLGSAMLHTMFGFDKASNGVEIFDPWIELAIIIQNNRLIQNQSEVVFFAQKLKV